MSKIQSVSLAIVAIGTLAACHTPLRAEPEPELADFAITVERSADGIRMTCSKGCAWTELTWEKPLDNPQAVDALGMTGGEE